MHKIVFLYFVLLSSFIVMGQEICNNGVDDDFDGLIDLNDSDCDCQIIPNPSFELMNCCPTDPQEINCSSSWEDASLGTTDYYNSCDYTFPGSVQALPGGGNGYVGFGTYPSNREYLGVCLNSPFIAGQQYTINLYLARGGGPTNVELAIFGTPMCSDLTWSSSSDCPIGYGSWTELISQNVNVGSSSSIGVWYSTSFTFTPNVNINAIAIGGGCNSTSGYYLIDDLTLSTSLTLGNIIESGSSCSQSHMLTASANISGGTWQWYKNGIALSGETNDTLDIMPYGFGDYSCLYTKGFECIQTHYTVTPPDLTANFSALSACAGDSVFFINYSSTSPGNIINYSWDFDDGSGYSNQVNPSYVYNSPGVYNVNLSITSDNHCKIDTTVSVEIFQNPTALFLNTTSCEGELTYFVDSSIVGSSQIIDYNWDFNQDGQIDDYISSPSYTFSSGPGLFSVFYSVTDANGCSSDTTIQVSVLPIPHVNLPNDTILCPNESITLQDTCENATFLWSTGSSNSFLTVNEPGTYWLTTSLNGCENSDTVTIDFFRFPNSYLGKDTSFCENDELILDVSTIEGDYLWSDGSTTPFINVLDTGTVWVETTTLCGKIVDSIKVDLNDCNCYVYIPNSFTPNNDGLNDIFKPEVKCETKDYYLTIFDRWGHEIYSTNNKTDFWNGKFMGKELPNDIYTYKLIYTDRFYKTVQKNGHISIIR